MPAHIDICSERMVRRRSNSTFCFQTSSQWELSTWKAWHSQGNAGNRKGCKTGCAARKPGRLINRNKIRNDKDAASCAVMSLPCQPKLYTVKKYLRRTCHRRVHTKHQSKTQQDTCCMHVYIYIYTLPMLKCVFLFFHIVCAPRRTESAYTPASTYV